jgi:hypothetical protein
MTYIRPVKLNISSAGEQLTPQVENNRIEIEDWSAKYNWAFNKVMDDSCTILDSDKLEAQLEESLENFYAPISDIEEYIAESLKHQSLSPFQRGRGFIASTVIHHNDAVIFPSSNEVMCSL